MAAGFHAGDAGPCMAAKVHYEEVTLEMLLGLASYIRCSNHNNASFCLPLSFPKPTLFPAAPSLSVSSSPLSPPRSPSPFPLFFFPPFSFSPPRLLPP
ncbi:unnamed protein product [Closterium sp. NIES-65]|nr:unnamed protein product [Closterium sp. NIES-65]